MVMELKLVAAVMLLLLLNFDAPLGNTRSSPATGAVPPQLPAVPQLLSPPPPVHVRVVALANAGHSRNRPARNATTGRRFIFSCPRVHRGPLRWRSMFQRD